jgi:cellulose biosynthesis protein BcsQ
MPVSEYDPRSAGAQAYAQLAEEFLRRDSVPAASAVAR